MVKTTFGQSYSNQLRKIPLADNTVGRKIDDISENLCEQLVSRMRSSTFSIQLDEATGGTASSTEQLSYQKL